MGSNRQTCKVCGRPDKFDFNVPDEIWRAIVPLEFQRKVVCLACFDDFACKKGVDYAYHLQTIWFAGDKASFQFIAYGGGGLISEIHLQLPASRFALHSLQSSPLPSQVGFSS